MEIADLNDVRRGKNMGIYLNPGNEGFKSAVRSKIYIDKTGLLEYTNSVLDTEQRYICVSRPRRFGKSITAEMLVAYYDKSCDSGELFQEPLQEWKRWKICSVRSLKN